MRPTVLSNWRQNNQVRVCAASACLYPARTGARIEEVALLFLRTHEVLAIHARVIEEFGGLHGVRDAGALEAALTAAENRAYYEQAPLPALRRM
jgi:hypothetical protein